MSPLVVVAAVVAGALMAVVRYGVTQALASNRRSLPVAVLVVNVVGSLIGGVAIALAESLGAADARYILLGGVAGGLTTFSTFSVETVQLAMSGRWRIAAGSVAANLVVGFAAVLAGWAATSALVA